MDVSRPTVRFLAGLSHVVAGEGDLPVVRQQQPVLAAAPTG